MYGCYVTVNLITSTVTDILSGPYYLQTASGCSPHGLFATRVGSYMLSPNTTTEQCDVNTIDISFNQQTQFPFLGFLRKFCDPVQFHKKRKYILKANKRKIKRVCNCKAINRLLITS